MRRKELTCVESPSMERPMTVSRGRPRSSVVGRPRMTTTTRTTTTTTTTRGRGRACWWTTVRFGLPLFFFVGVLVLAAETAAAFQPDAPWTYGGSVRDVYPRRRSIIVAPSTSSSGRPARWAPPQRPDTTTLPPRRARRGLANSFMDDVFNFFDPYGNNEKKTNDGKGRSSHDDDENDNDDEVPAGTTRIVSIPVKSIKPGGLRLFLMFYLLGQQNHPDKNTWKANQPSTEEYVLEFWYRDMSAVLTLTLESHQITLDRTGSSPSVSYLMQETSIVQGILDELQLMASDDLVDTKDRLLLLQQPDSIQQARDGLAFS